MNAPLTHILPLTNIRRLRFLPVNGRVLVKAGAKVNSTDVIAEADIHGKYILMDVRRAMGVQRASEAEKLIQRKVGEKLTKGEVVAETTGLFNRVLRASANGSIAAISNGQVLFEIESSVFSLQAGMPGQVVIVYNDQGVLLETNGSLIQGVWGNNRIDSGMLYTVLQNPDDELKPEMIDVNARGTVLVSGYCKQAEVLRMAAEAPVRGLVLASMASELITQSMDLPFPIMLLEGFGRIPMNSVAFKLLTSSEKREVNLNSCSWDFYKGDRPELIIPLPASAEQPIETINFKGGQIVRVQTAPYAGLIGKITEMLPGLTPLPNGLKAESVSVKLENGEDIIVPLANLDVIQ
jgi:hypothetical protein